MLYGTTFSHPYIRDYFKLPVKKAFQELLGLKFDLVRLCCYWNEIEKKKGEYDFSAIEELLEMAEQANQAVVLTVGMKAPRWPEFHLPKWTHYQQILSSPAPLFKYLQKSFEELLQYSCIKYWQVENEPLDPSGPRKMTIPSNILKKEIELLREKDKRPIIISLWGNKSLTDHRLAQIEELADIVGLDLYYKIPKTKQGFWGPTDKQRTLRKIIKDAKKPIWLTELQTNPWKNRITGTNQELMEYNLRKASYLRPAAIIFWGYEYWYWQKIQKRNNQVWQKVEKLLSDSKYS